MLELLSPAGTPEAVIAAVQNGADAVYMGLGNYNARRGARNFTGEEFEKAIRYCHVRGCKLYLTLNTVVSDREIEDAVRFARMAAKFGCDGIIIQDLGLIKVIRQAVPDIHLHGSTQMSIHNLAGAEAAAEMGLKRIVLSRELSLDKIKFITQNCQIETEIFVHGALCFCYSGQCYMSALIGRRSGNRGMCAQPCRMQYSISGRTEDYPLSLKDNCLVDRLKEIEDAGVACIKIEGRMKRPEYTAVVTDIYSKVLHDNRTATEDEMKTLSTAFSRDGFTQGYFDGDKKDMLGTHTGDSREADTLFDRYRKAYADQEARRVPVHFYTVVEQDKPIQAIAFDNDGNKATVQGAVPQIANSRALTEGYICDQMYKTGGTPYLVVENKAKVDPGLYASAAEINDLRRTLISQLSEERGLEPKVVRAGKIPPLPENVNNIKDPYCIIQIRTGDQMSKELADLRPAYLYVPVEILNDNFDLTKPFTDNGTTIVAVVPRIVTDNQSEDVTDMLMTARAHGVNEALCGNLGHIYMARKAGMSVRGDFGFNVFNSYSLQVLEEAGLISATASFELRIAQIKDLAKSIDTEMIVYGRFPLMVSEQCVIKNSAGNCQCAVPAQMSDRMGSVFPIVKEYGCRNVIYNAHKLYLADKKEDLYSTNCWGLRLLFTTENARECVEITKTYMGLSDYKPNVLTRGLYYRGVD